jgi:hypothetical protein
MLSLARVCSIKHNQGMKAMLEKKWITTSEAARLIGCTAGRVRKMCADAILQSEKVGPRVWLIDLKSAQSLAQKPYTTGRPRKNQK